MSRREIKVSVSISSRGVLSHDSHFNIERIDAYILNKHVTAGKIWRGDQIALGEDHLELFRFAIRRKII
jgi:hypothetical protein